MYGLISNRCCKNADLRLRFADVDIVDLHVGTSKTSFRVHKDQLCEASAFFKAAFGNDHFREGQTKEMTLQDDDAQIFELFIQWIYKDKPALTYLQEEESGKIYLLDQLKLWVLGNKYDVPGLRQHITDLIFAALKSGKIGLPTPSVSYLYANSSESSGLRRLVVDWSIWRVRKDWFAQPKTHACLLKTPEFAVELTMAFSQKSGKADPFAAGSAAAYY